MRRFGSAAVLITMIVLLLMLDFHLAKPESLGRAGVALSIISVLLVSLAASEFISLWTAADGSSLTHPVHRTIPALPVVMISAVLMAVIACCLPVATMKFTTAQSWNSVREIGSWHPLLFSLGGLLFAFSITFVYEMWGFNPDAEQPGNITDRIGRSALIYLYLSTLFGFLIPHRWLQSNEIGLIAIIALISTIKLSDSSALFAGKAFGTVKFAPRLSPKKTMQGVLGAYVGAFLASAVVFFVVAPKIFGISIDRPWWWFAIYPLTIATIGIFGDLAESMLKRDAQRKDSSSWIPGLGGILDVLDSLVFACPISYLLWLI